MAPAGGGAMHEWSLVQALVDRVEREAAARSARAVTRLRLRVGELAGVERELFTLAYETYRERTICARAELEIVDVPARWSCPECGESPAPGAVLRCPRCDRPARLVEGDGIVLERIEMEVA